MYLLKDKSVTIVREVRAVRNNWAPRGDSLHRHVD